MNYSALLSTMRRQANIGLWGSLAAIALAALFFLIGLWHFIPSNEHTSRVLLVAAAVLAVLAVSATLMVIRKRIPVLRQSEGLDAKLPGYTRMVGRLFLGVLAVEVAVCLMAVLADQSALLMLAIVAVLMLFMAYPNMYKMKVDLGLSDDEMRTLFGDRYTAPAE